MSQKQECDVEKLKKDIDSIKKEIDNVQELIDAIDGVWQGNDKKKFLKEFSKKREELKKHLDESYIKLKDVL